MEAFYDLSKSPVTHDFCNWLVRAEQERIKSGEETLEVRLVRGTRLFSYRDYLYQQERRDRRVYELLMPLSRLVPSVTDVSMVDTGEQTFPYHNFQEPQAPIFKASPIDRSIVAHFLEPFKRPVTLTIRQADFESDRNTLNEEWRVALTWLVANDMSPIVIPDAEAEMTGLMTGLEGDFIHYPAASFSPGIRLALYEQSALNLITTGGPMVLGLFADIPMMAFKLIVPGINCCQPQHMINSAMTPDSDWGPRKRLCWAADTAQNIIKKLEVELPYFKGAYQPEQVKDLFSMDYERLEKKVTAA